MKRHRYVLEWLLAEDSKACEKNPLLCCLQVCVRQQSITYFLRDLTPTANPSATDKQISFKWALPKLIYTIFTRLALAQNKGKGQPSRF